MKKFIKLTALFINVAVIATLFAGCTVDFKLGEFLDDIEVSNPFDYDIVAHATGEIDGLDYTNSIQAMQLHYNGGTRLFEIDLTLTSDGEVVGAHMWEDSLFPAEWSHANPPTLEEYEAHQVAGKYTGLTMSNLLSFLNTNEDVRVIVDTKYNNESALFAKIVEDTLAYDSLIMNRIIPQLLDRGMYDDMEAIYSFSRYTFAPYTTLLTNNQIKSFLEDHSKVQVLAVSTTRLALMGEGYVQDIHELGVKMYVHTVNNFTDVDNYLEKGITGFYTDTITENSYDNYTNN